MVEEERKFLNFDKSDAISIIPSATMDPALIIDIKDFKGGDAIASAPDEQGPYAMAIRQKPVLLSS